MSFLFVNNLKTTKNLNMSFSSSSRAGARLEDRLYEHLEWTVPPRPRVLELLGNEMTQAGLEIGSNTPYGGSDIFRVFF